MEDKNFKEKLSDHWARYRNKYFVVGGIMVCTSVAAIVGYKLGYKAAPNQIVNLDVGALSGALNVGDGQANNSPRVLTINTITAGHPGDIIEDPLTGEKWLSQRKACDALGVSKNTLWKKIEDGDLINHGANTGVALV